MKKIILLIFISAVIIIPAFSQSLEMAESAYYRVYSDISKENAEFVASVMDKYFELYNKYFHFDPEALSSRLKLRIFGTKKAFDGYLSSLIDETSSSYVYLQYRDQKKSELVIYVIDDLEEMNRVLAHHGFVQFLKTFIPEPPLWMQKGFAVYFENSMYNYEDQTVTFRRNMDWVISLKKYVTADRVDPVNPKLFTPEKLFTLDIDEANSSINVFYAQSWGVVSFLLNSEYMEYNRILWDAISALDPAASKNINEQSVMETAFNWIDENTFTGDFYSYAESLKTFNELVNDGVAAYTEGKLEESENYFIQSMTLNESSYIPYYYLGLINYSRKDFDTAEYYYHSSLEMGGDPDLTYYALGVNAYANSSPEDCTFYLEKIGPGEYKDKAGEIIELINGPADDKETESESAPAKETSTKSGK